MLILASFETKFTNDASTLELRLPSGWDMEFGLAKMLQ